METEGLMPCIKDGEEIWRAIDHIEVQDERIPTRHGPSYSRPIPVLAGDEQLVWTISDHRPIIRRREW